MDTVRLGRTGLVVSKNGFGALPIQRVSKEEAIRILRKAYDSGINYFDTAHVYSDSEEKLGCALHDVRDRIIISTKAMTTTAEGFRSQLDESLRRLQTDYTIFTSSTIPPLCPVLGTAPVCMRPCWKPRHRAKSATSASPITA